MITADRGRKYLCPSCETKYYDMKKETVTCPKCGTKPPAPKVPRSTRPVKKASGTTFRRF